MKTTGRRGRARHIGLVACLIAGAGIIQATPAAGTGQTTEPIVVTDRPPDGAEGSIDDVAEHADAPSASRVESSLSDRARRTQGGGSITVEVLGDDASVRAAVAEVGGTLGRGGGGLFLASVPAQKVSRLGASPGIAQVRTPVSAEQQRASVPEDIEDMNVERGPVQSSQPLYHHWHDHGYLAQGEKVGFIAYFNTTTLAAQTASGEIPAVPPAQRKCVSAGVACTFGSTSGWGNALAEIFADTAPDASLYLAELDYIGDYYPIIDWFAANGVTIVVNPIIWPYDGAGNGTGPASAIVDYAVSKGIAWFNTAGEMAPNTNYTGYIGSYWKGTWADPDNDRWMNFSGIDETLSVYCGSLLGLRWSDWGKPSITDYDLWISDFKYSNKTVSNLKTLSANNQSLAGAVPLEGTGFTYLCNTNPAFGPVYDVNNDGFVSLWVQRKSTSPASGAVGDLLEIGALNGFMEYSVAAGSVGIAFADSKNPGESTVGGYHQNLYDWTSPSHGPTNDGRTKPDVAGPVCFQSSVLVFTHCGGAPGSFYGADGAAAFVAGLAALARQALKIPNPPTLMKFVKDNSYIDPAWPRGNQGFGVTQLAPGAPPQPYAPGYFVPQPTPTRVLDTRDGTGTYKVGALLPEETRAVAGFSGIAVVLNVAAVASPGNGYISVFPHGWSYAGSTSAINVMPGQTRSNLVIVPVGSGGFIDFYAHVGGHVVVDLIGTMQYQPTDDEPGANFGSGRLRTVEPTRVVDSRTCLGVSSCTGAALPPDTFIDVPLRGFVDPSNPDNVVPDDAIAVALSVTVDTPAANGFLSAIPGNTTSTASSNLNYEAGKSATTLTMVRVDGGADGVVRLFLKRSAHLQVEILGWFTAAQGFADREGMFAVIAPTRLLDTRQPPNSKPLAGAHVTVATTAMIGTDAAMAIYLNNVSVQPVAPGELQVSATVPSSGWLFRNLTFPTAGLPIAAATLSALDNGSYVMSPSQSTHLVSDTTGYFMSAVPPAPPGSVVRVTHTVDAAPLSNTSSRPIGASNDGEYVLFVSDAINLVDNPTTRDYYVWRRSTGAITQLPFDAYSVVIGGDGSLLVSTLAALSPTDVNDALDVYKVVLDPLTFTRVTGDGYNPYFLGRFFALSDDGNKVMYVEDGTGTRVLRVINLTAGTTVTVQIGYPADSVMSDDGSAFIASYVANQIITVKRFNLATGAVTAQVAFPSDRSVDLIDVTTDLTKVSITIFLSHSAIVDLATGTVSRIPYSPSAYSYLEYAGRYLAGDQHILEVGPQNIWVTSLDGRNVDVVNSSWDGSPLNGGIPYPGFWPPTAVSPNGRFVVFATLATNLLDENPGPGHLYIVDLAQL